MLDEITPYYNPETIREFKRKHEYVPVEFTITERSRALRGNVKSYEVPIFHSYDASLQLNNTKKQIIKLLMRLLKDKRGFKFNITLKVRLSKSTENGTITREPYFNAGPFTVTNSDDIEEAVDNAIERILELIARWLSEGSGWRFELSLLHNINIVSYFPLKGKSYIKLPVELCNPNNTLVNPKNEDNRCFLWCHNRYLNPLKVHPERITKADRESVKKLDYTGVTFPVTIKDMKKIEKQNQINIEVDVIASNFEKYIGFNIGKHLTFIDSFSFMSQSLDRLSSNLSDDAFFHTREAFPNDDQFRLIKKKGVYPYDYMDSFQRFSERSLPEIEDFYSILNDTNISESEYSHAKRVWSTFQIRRVS